MEHEQLVSMIKPIVEGIDKGIEVRITHTPEEQARRVFRIHLSKRGIITWFHATLEEIINAATDHEQLRAKLEKAIEAIRRQTELVAKGTVAKLQPLLCGFAVEEGLSPEPSSGRPDFTSDDWDYASLRINSRRPQGRSRSLGRIEMQGLPDDETLLIFNGTVRGKLPPEEDREAFWDFCSRFVNRLVQLGFVEKPPPPKREIGFHKP